MKTKIYIILTISAAGSTNNNSDRLKFWHTNRNSLIKKKKKKKITATQVLIYKIQFILNTALINDKKMWHHNTANE